MAAVAITRTDHTSGELRGEAARAKNARMSQRLLALALVLDGAGRHSSPRLKVPDNIVLLPLPPYAPELNPTDNLREYLRGNYLSHEVHENYEAVVDACRDAWNALMKLPEVILSTGNRTYSQVAI